MKAMFVRTGPWSVILACLVFAPVVHAASVVDDPALLDQFRLEQQQRQSQVEEALKRPRSKVSVAPEKKPIKLLAEGECRPLNKIWLYGADHLPDKIKRDLNKTYLKSCISNVDIENIIKVVQDWYLNSGYITTRVVLKPNQSSFDIGNLEIYVREGYIDKVTLDKDTDFDKRRVRFALPGIKDQILNIKQLDQGIEVMNRGFASSVNMQVKPSEIPAHSTIVLSEKRNASTAFTDGLGRNLGRQKISFTLNNSGSESTGEFLDTTSLERDNLFGINDNLQLSWTKSSPSVDNEKQNLNQSARFTMPYGKWDFTLSKYDGFNIRTVDGGVTTFSSSGDTINYTIDAKRLLFRDNSRKVEVKITAKHSNKKNYINDTLVEVSSRRMSSLDLGMNFNWFSPTDTIILSPSLSGGMPWFDSITDPADVQATDPHAEYSIYKLYATVYQNIAAKTHFPFTWSISLNGQSTRDVQYSENQFILGGEYSVRGYKNNVLSGDVGWSIRNDFTLPLGKWFSGEDTPKALYPINFKLFYDYGEVKTLSDNQSDRLEGYGWGLGYQYRWFTLNYSQALALRQSDQFTGAEGWVQYYSAGFNFTL